MERLGTAVRITWTTVGGSTNVVEASADVLGPYTGLGEPIVIPGTGSTQTNYLDASGSLTGGRRFYRVSVP